MVIPADATIPASGGESTHQVHNNSDQRMMFKVKISNTDDYRVHPVYGFVDASGTTDLHIFRRSAPAKTDKMVIQFAPAPSDCHDAKQGFSQVHDVSNDNMLTVNLNAE